MKSFLLLFVLVCNICNASINFVHIQKTGGSTISILLKERFEPSQIYAPIKLKGLRPYATNKKEVRELFKNTPEINHELVLGHHPMWFFLEKDPNYGTSFFFTVLRDPIARTLSQLRYRKREGRPRTNPLQAPFNNMCKILCTDCTLEGEELLEDAIRSLHRMNFLIFMDDFNNGVRALFKELNLPLEDEIPHYNTTTKEQVSDEDIEIIKQRNTLDIRLYEYAKAHYNPETHTLN